MWWAAVLFPFSKQIRWPFMGIYVSYKIKHINNLFLDQKNELDKKV